MALEQYEATLIARAAHQYSAPYRAA